MRVTLALMTFNQAPFLAEAIESALAQDYQPLRILVSDNGSNDNTPGIVQSAVHNFDGPHEVLTTRFAVNSGSPSSHLNALIPHLEDDIIVLQAGDDRSHPGRVSAIVKAFAANPGAQLVFHGWEVIDERGRRKSRGCARLASDGDQLGWFASVSHYALGATLAIKKDLLLDWPALPHHIFEDNVLPFRAALKGPIIYLEQALLDYRRHFASTVAADHRLENLAVFRETLQRSLERKRQIFQVRRSDLAIALNKNLIDAQGSERLLQIAEESLRDAELQAGLFDRDRRNRRLALKQLWRRKLSAKERIDLLARGFLPQVWTAYRRWRQS